MRRRLGGVGLRICVPGDRPGAGAGMGTVVAQVQVRIVHGPRVVHPPSPSQAIVVLGLLLWIEQAFQGRRQIVQDARR